MAIKVEFITAGVGDVVSGAGKVAGALGDVAKLAAGFAVGQGLAKAPAILMDLASASRDLELQAKKANTVFGDQIGVVEKWADANAKGMGLTSREATNLAAGLADLLVPMGMSREQAAKMSTETLNLSGALAEWSGGQKSAADVASILQSAYLGETDGLKALGISISAADVQARLAAKGQDELTGAAAEQAQALAIQELIMEKSTDAQKAFAEGSGSAARKQAEMSATVKEAKQDLAVALGPAISAVTTQLAEFVPKIIEVATAFAEWLKPKIEEFVAFMGPKLAEAGEFFMTELLPRIQAFMEWLQPVLAELGAWVGEQFAKFKLYYESDIKPALENIIAGVSAVIGFIVEHWPEIWAVVEPIMDMIKTHVQTIVGVVMEIFQILMDLISGDFSGAWKNLQELIALIWNDIKSIISNTIEAIIELMKGLGPLMLEALGNMSELLVEAGKDIIRGLIRGIDEMKDEALGKIGDVAGSMKDKAKDVFKINSPSLVFAEIGEGIMEGLEKGIFDEQKRPLNAMDKLAIGIRQAMDKLTTNEAGGGGPEAAMKRITQALLDMGYTMEEIEPNAKKIMESLSAATNEAGDGAITYAEAIEQILKSFDKLFADPDVKAVVTATVKPSGKENSSANASGGSLLGIGNAPKPGEPMKVAAQDTKKQQKEAIEAADRREMITALGRIERILDRMEKVPRTVNVSGVISTDLELLAKALVDMIADLLDQRQLRQYQA